MKRRKDKRGAAMEVDTENYLRQPLFIKGLSDPERKKALDPLTKRASEVINRLTERRRGSLGEKKK